MGCLFTHPGAARGGAAPSPPLAAVRPSPVTSRAGGGTGLLINYPPNSGLELPGRAGSVLETAPLPAGKVKRLQLRVCREYRASGLVGADQPPETGFRERFRNDSSLLALLCVNDSKLYALRLAVSFDSLGSSVKPSYHVHDQSTDCGVL